jgi:hypothetical protein
MGAAREHGIADAIAEAASPDAYTAYQGGGPAIRVLQRRRRIDPTPAATDACHGARSGSTPHTPVSAAGQRVNAELKNWRVLRKIRCFSRACELVAAVQTS